MKYLVYQTIKSFPDEEALGGIRVVGAAVVADRGLEGGIVRTLFRVPEKKK